MNIAKKLRKATEIMHECIILNERDDLKCVFTFYGHVQQLEVSVWQDDYKNMLIKGYVYCDYDDAEENLKKLLDKLIDLRLGLEAA